MIKRKLTSITATLTLLLVYLSAHNSIADESAPREKINVRLKPNASVTDRIVLLKDVADVEEGDPETVRQLQQLDLSEPPDESDSIVVSRSQVRIRLLLSGLPASRFLVFGANQCRIGQPSGGMVDEKTMLDLIRRDYSEQLRVAEHDLELRLLRPISLTHDYSNTSNDAISMKPYLPENVRAGTSTVRVAINVDGRLREVASITLEVKVFRTVSRAAQRIDREAYITEDDVVKERIALADAALREYATSVIGSQARRQLQPGEVINTRDIKAPPAPQDPIVIRPRDQITLVAQKGGITIKVNNAMALESGRIGDSIRVQNTRSNAIITGRIASRSTVEISF